MLQPKQASRPGARDARRGRLLEIIKAQSLLTGSEFTLASGQRSSFFFDMKKTMFHPEGAALAADIIFEMIAGDADVQAVGGLEIGAIPIAVAVAARSWPSRPISAFFVRKAPKDHGAINLIDGQFRPGAHVILFEDVTTTGGSVMKAVRAVRDQGGTVKKIVTIVDRGEGAAENLKKEGLELVAIFTMDDFS
ncbi:MAG TPA: orotate phosphoribosyltransferase [Xanthobacteraceae bacterium]